MKIVEPRSDHFGEPGDHGEISIGIPAQVRQRQRSPRSCFTSRTPEESLLLQAIEYGGAELDAAPWQVAGTKAGCPILV